MAKPLLNADETLALAFRHPITHGNQVRYGDVGIGMELTPDLVGATETQNSGIIGEKVELNLVHAGDVRPSQVLYELTSHLVLTKWRDPGEDPKLYLFGQLKRIAKQWLDGGCLVCKGGTYPAQLKYKMLADMACKRITDGITRAFSNERPVALFKRSTQAMKAQWKVPDNRPLADFAPTIILKAKDFATEITIFNAREHQMTSEPAISHEHVTNNEAVRRTLLERGIRPETLPAAEDVKKVQRRLTSEEKKALKNPESLDC